MCARSLARCAQAYRRAKERSPLSLLKSALDSVELLTGELSGTLGSEAGLLSATHLCLCPGAPAIRRIFAERAVKVLRKHLKEVNACGESAEARMKVRWQRQSGP